jgi:hypothetical protein
MNAKAKTVAKPRPITEDDFLTIPEIAFLQRHPRTGEPLKRASIEQLRVRYRDSDNPDETEAEKAERLAKALPAPDGHLGSVPYWRLSRILVWSDLQNRPYDVDSWREKRESGGFRRHQDLI